MKFFFTAIILIIFYFASAQNNTSGFKSSNSSILFTDFKPNYTTEKSKFCNFYIDKIEYTKEEMIFYFHIVNSNKHDMNFPISKKEKEVWFLKSGNKIFNIYNIKNFRLNDKPFSSAIPKDSVLHCQVNKGGKLTCEIYFPRLPEEIKLVNLINGYDGVKDSIFSYFNIQIKYPDDNNSDKKEKDFSNEMELNKPLTLNKIFFETGKSNLLDSSFAELNTLFNILKSKPKMIIQISGYTDNTGNAQDNIVLSEARANAVKKYLTDKGIDNNRIIAKGYGSSNPKASNDTAEGRAKNRRVEIMVLKN